MSDAPEPTPVEASGEEEVTADQISQIMYERLAAAPVPAVFIQTMATFADLAAIRIGLGPEGDARKDMSEARLAIEALRALVPLCEAALGGEQSQTFAEALSGLQMAYIETAERDRAADPNNVAPGAVPQPPPPPAPAPKIETPGGGGGGLWVPPNLRP